MSIRKFVPPADLIGHASGSLDADVFFAIGDEFMKYFREFGQIQPRQRILDLGCGCGRMAMPLLSFLDKTGSYEGVDVDAKSIEWASATITPNYPNFRFQVANVFNTTYNLSGTVPPNRYQLPFADQSFDFAFLTSVFTHMLPNGMRNYLEEVSRVLKVGGRCLITYFLLNDTSAAGIKAGKAVFQMPYRFGPCAVQDEKRPEDVIGYDEEVVADLFPRSGLEIDGPIRYGCWSGREHLTTFQDLVVAKKVRHLTLVGKLSRGIVKLFESPDRPQFARVETYAKAA